jgi:hypothetical protein
LQDKSNSPQRPHRAVADVFALFVTEGARKADAAVSRELCCIDPRLELARDERVGR